jgi:ankyrin repeat protein
LPILVTVAVFLGVGCGQSPEQQVQSLLTAARIGDTKAVKSLLNKGVNVNARKYPKGWTALQYAAAGAHLETVKLLVESGADVKAAGSADGGKGGGTVMFARAVVDAQASLAILGYTRGGKVTFEPEPDGPLLATDPDAEKRYQEVIKLLEDAEAKLDGAKSK